jgi:Periplasmic binding protein
MTRRTAAVLTALALVLAACGSRTDGGDAAPAGEEQTEAGSGSGAGATDVGVTDDAITIGVIADLTGVVPGLFKAAPDAVQAYAAMVNEAGGIHGRELVVEVYDTGTNDNGNRLAYEEACGQVFASVGSRLRRGLIGWRSCRAGASWSTAHTPSSWPAAAPTPGSSLPGRPPAWPDQSSLGGPGSPPT